MHQCLRSIAYDHNHIHLYQGECDDIKCVVRVYLAAAVNDAIAIPLFNVATELEQSELQDVCIAYSLTHIQSLMKHTAVLPSMSTVLLERLDRALKAV